ncbi:MAG: NAD(P)-binding domain-containing protein [Elusimicrobia bacterium]|nr:NAD(P)-binding domain-containing protein [Elusimicrobiota bacterium]
MGKPRVGIVGSGTVAQALGAGFAKKGWEVVVGTRDPGKLAGWKATAGPGVRIGSFQEAAKFGSIVVLAVKGTVAEQALQAAGIDHLKGKTVLDACNPIADAAPEDGVLRYVTGPNESLMEKLQKLAPEARLVKAFSCIGSHFMVDPKFPGGKPTMFICGDDANSKKEAAAVCEEFGFEVSDMGTAKAARAIEPLAMLWCIPGIRENSWTHAFKLLQA